jgi:N6-adenosine-specific RNA methylase IME4
VTEFIGLVVITGNYKSFTDLYSLQIITAHTRSQSVVSLIVASPSCYSIRRTILSIIIVLNYILYSSTLIEISNFERGKLDSKEGMIFLWAVENAPITNMNKLQFKINNLINYVELIK